MEMRRGGLAGAEDHRAGTGRNSRGNRRWQGGAFGLLAAALFFAGSAAATPLVQFGWSPGSSLVAPGASSVDVSLQVDQSGGADAAGLTLGLATSGIVTGVDLGSFGSAVSAPDSFFGTTAGKLLLIAVAPASPGSFGADAGFSVATLHLLLDTSLGSTGSVSLLDLSNFAGPPALEMDGTTAIPADLTAVHVVSVVPEPATGLLLGFGAAGLLLVRRRRTSVV